MGDSRELDTPPRSRRRKFFLITAAGLGLLLCVQPLFTDDEVSPPSSWHGDGPLTSDQLIVPSVRPTGASLNPTGTAAPTPTTTSPTRSAASRAATVPQSPKPLMLGPSDDRGVTKMVDEYCDRHVSGGSAESRDDGRWQCDRFLAFAKIVDMDVACGDSYGAGAYAQTSDADDPYAWRCYRR